jgi:hypothetical protein
MSSVLDIRTLILVITIVLVCRALIMGYIWSISRYFPPVKQWMVGSALVAVGAMLLTLRGSAPEVLTVLLAQTCLDPRLVGHFCWHPEGSRAAVCR